MGHRLGPYTLGECLGKGRSGEVYRAVDEDGAEVALKLINVSPADRQLELLDFKDALFRRVEALARAETSGVARVLSAGHSANRYYVAREVVEGASLAARLTKPNRELTEAALGILRNLAGALADFHDNGVLHLRLHPGNIFLLEGGGVVVTDPLYFGDGRDATPLRVLFADPRYCAPEVLAGEPVGPAADLYSLGVIFYRIMTGKFPFEGSAEEVLAAARKGAPAPSQRNRVLSGAVDGFTLRALAPDPAKRFESADEFRAAVGYLIEAGPFLEEDSDPLAETDRLEAARAAELAQEVAEKKKDRRAQALAVPAVDVAPAALDAPAVSPAAATEEAEEQEEPAWPSPPRRKKSSPLPWIALLVVGLVAGGVYFGGSGGPEPEPTATVATPSQGTPRPASGLLDAAQLEVTSSPPGAGVFIGGRFKGVTPFKTTLKVEGDRREFLLALWKLGFTPRRDIVRIGTEPLQKLDYSFVRYEGERPLPVQGGWTTYRGNGARTGYRPEPIEPPLHTVWERNVGLNVGVAPVVMGDLVVLTGKEPYVRALSLTTGEERWEFIGAGGTSAAAVLREDAMWAIVAGKDAVVHILDLDDGDEAASIKLQSYVESSPVVDDKGRIFVATAAGRVVAIDAKPRSLFAPKVTRAWQADLEDDVEAPLSLASNMVVVRSKHYVTALDRSDGRRLWRYSLPETTQTDSLPLRVARKEPPMGAPVVYGNLILVAHESGRLIGIDSNSGEASWELPVRPKSPVIASPAVGNGFIVFATQDGRVYGAALSPQPILTWTARLEGGVVAPPAVAGNVVFFADTKGKFYAIDVATGQISAKQRLDGPVVAAPALAGRRIITVSTAGTVVCFEGS